MKHIFGPVYSRRLGSSLGIDLFSKKICNLNCVYCELGSSPALFTLRKEYSSTQGILDEINQYHQKNPHFDTIDVITVTASGEPTLHSGCGTVLEHIQSLSQKPLALLTNATTLTDPQVRQEISPASIVIPSLDAALKTSFVNVDRPAPSLRIDEIIQGLKTFSHEYQGEIWLEILLVAGINDSEEDICALQTALQNMRIDRIQLNSVVRPPAETFAMPVADLKLQNIAQQLQSSLNLPVDLPGYARLPQTSSSTPSLADAQDDGQKRSKQQEQEVAICEMLKRRPCTAEEIAATLQVESKEQLLQMLFSLQERTRIETLWHQDTQYYRVPIQ